MSRSVRLWTGPDDASYVTVEETASSGALAWHTAPVRQHVVTLAGTLVFSSRTGEHFTLHPGDMLLAEDTAGSGHQWRLEGSDPWRRVYVVLSDADVPFVAD
jgi:quercetin dioxygenase-like cupin family protein